jgi:hypothetical protein
MAVTAESLRTVLDQVTQELARRAKDAHRYSTALSPANKPPALQPAAAANH